MKRIPLLLVALISLLMVVSGSALASARHATASPTNTSAPTISGTAATGATLTATSGAWNGATPISYAYQWQRCNSSGSGCGTISSATNQNYVVSNGDSGRTIRVQVTATNSDGSNQALSAATATIANPGAVPANTKQPDPSGKAEDGQKVTVDPGNWSGQKPITFTYQWQSCNAASVCTDIAGATSQSFTVTSSQVGSKLRATVTATNSAGKASASSNLTVCGHRQDDRLAGQHDAAADLRVGARRAHRSVLDRRLDGRHDDVRLPVEPLQHERDELRQHLRRDRPELRHRHGRRRQRASRQRHRDELDRLGQRDLGRSTITATFVLRASFTATLRAGQEVSRPHGIRAGRCGTLHREADRQHAPLDADVHAPDRAADGRRAEQGPARHERSSVQDALPQLLLARARDDEPDRIAARRAGARTRRT